MGYFNHLRMVTKNHLFYQDRKGLESLNLHNKHWFLTTFLLVKSFLMSRNDDGCYENRTCVLGKPYSYQEQILGYFLWNSFQCRFSCKVQHLFLTGFHYILEREVKIDVVCNTYQIHCTKFTSGKENVTFLSHLIDDPTTAWVFCSNSTH